MPTPPADPFATLGLEPRFDLDPATIERAYLKKAAQSHPDLQPDLQPGLQPDQQDASAALNKARNTLLNAESRANALLDHLGGPRASEHRHLPEGFLQDIMQTRLEIEEAAASADPDAIAKWRIWADDERRRYTSLTAAAFADPDRSQSHLADIRTQLNAWRYIERLIEQLPGNTS